MIAWLKIVNFILLAGIAGSISLSCDKVNNLGLKNDENKQTKFSGVRSINLTSDGAFFLYWDQPSSDYYEFSQFSFEIYMTQVSETQAAELSADVESDDNLGTLITVSPDLAPYGNGPLLATVKGERSYKLENQLEIGSSYLFQVKSVSPDGARDGNSAALLLTVTDQKLEFAGLQSAEVTGEEIILNWQPANKNTAVGEVFYKVYEGPDFDKVIKIVKDTGYALSTEGYLPGEEYTFGVKAFDDRGEPDDNNVTRSIVLEKLKFEGLRDENVIYHAADNKVLLSWKAAVNVSGAVRYIIYSDANFQQVIATVKELSWDFVGPEIGKSYTFAVKAKDDTGMDENNEFVTITIPDPRDKTPPLFNGIASATTQSNSKILLKWDASPSEDLAQYNIYHAYDLENPIGSTTDLFFTVTGLLPATLYSFVVRAEDTSKNIDQNTVTKSAETLPYPVPDFSGLKTVERYAGIQGLSELKLTWYPAGGTVTGYRVFQSSDGIAFDFDSPIATIADELAADYTVTGLQSDTPYYFVVRAYELKNATIRSELNNIIKSNSTLPIKAPTFAGISGAQPGSGDLALSTAVLSWLPPQTDGVHDSFAIHYEEGTCDSAFTNSANEVIANGASLTNFTVTGLSGQKNYRFRVRARYSLNDTRDMNTACKSVYTSPDPPEFGGIQAVATSAGIQGFDSLDLTWNAATNSFTHYLVEWSTSANMSPIGGSHTISNRATVSYTLAGLPAKTTIYVRVTAVYTYSSVTLTAGEGKVLAGNTTPPAPDDEAVSALTVVSADSIKIDWTLPTNVNAVYNQIKFWKACSANAATDLLAKLGGAADLTLAAAQTSYTDSGLASNVECCYQIRAHYDDTINTLASSSQSQYMCTIPELLPPTFAGAVSLINPNTAQGFSQLIVSWNEVAASDAGKFSYYEIDVATAPDGFTWSSPIQVNTISTTSYTLTGLTENTTYYAKVRAVNANGSPSVSAGQAATRSAATTPKVPTGDSIANLNVASSTSLELQYNPTDADKDVGGLVNNIFLYIAQGTTSDATAHQTSLPTVTTGDVDAVMVTGIADLSAVTLPALIRIPTTTELTFGQMNSYEIKGLAPNLQYCVLAEAVYWSNGQPNRYLQSATPSTQCATPSATAPNFSGVDSLSGFDDNRDFTQLIANWNAPTGECTSVEISVTLTQDSPNWTTPAATATCGATSATIGGLSAHTEYFVQVRAINDVGGSQFISGEGVELSRYTRPVLPAGDGMTSATANDVPKAADTVDLVFAPGSSGYFNKGYIWKAEAASQGAAETAVRAKAIIKGDGSGPTQAPEFEVTQVATTYTDTNLSSGVITCYLMKSVYEDGTYYNSSNNTTTACVQPLYTTPIFNGVVSASLAGTWPDGTAKIQLTFDVTPGGSIEEYWIYTSASSDFGDQTKLPWQVIDKGDSDYDPNPNDNTIYAGGIGFTVAGDRYFAVRYKYYGGIDDDTNTNYAGPLTIPASQSNFVMVASADSSLGYDLYMMQYEGVATGSLAADTVTEDEANLKTCNQAFHESADPDDASCGTRNSDVQITSYPNQVPTDLTFAQAWHGCRNSSLHGSLLRLPTETEWRALAKYDAEDYAGYRNALELNCNVDSGSLVATAADNNCASVYGIYDQIGNASEWVDQRMVANDINAAGLSRFSYGPVIGRTLDNGIDGLSRNIHKVSPSSTLHLAMGASHAQDSDAAYVQGQDLLREQWTTGSSNSGDTAIARCVMLLDAMMPSMEALAQPQEPKFVAADIDPFGDKADWAIPENFYVGDTAWEKVEIQEMPFKGDANAMHFWNFDATNGYADVVNGNDLIFEGGLNTLTSSTDLNGDAFNNFHAASAGDACQARLGSTNNLDYIDTNYDNNGIQAGTTAFWIYKDDWTADPTNAEKVYRRVGYSFFLDYHGAGWFEFGFPWNEQWVQMPDTTSGWHHIAIVEHNAMLHKIYFDGQLTYTGTFNQYYYWNDADDFFCNSTDTEAFNGKLANFMIQGGAALNETEVNNLMNMSIPGNDKHFDGDSLNYGKINITWRPWKKTYCSQGSCQEADNSQFTYELYRFIEPSGLDERSAIPWAMMDGAHYPSATVQLDPLGRKADGSAMYTPIQTRSGTTCNTGQTSGCFFNDVSGGSTDPGVLYFYVIVVVDNDGNRMPAMVQRYRSPYIAGDPAPGATIASRTELRLRRASFFAVDEHYQTKQASPQVMRHVPMDESGLDRDFYIHKYEAHLVSGGFSENDGYVPESAIYGSSTWKQDAAECHEKLRRNSTFDSSCGSNTTTGVLGSAPAKSPARFGTQGDFWRACRNAVLVDSAGQNHRLHMVTGAEIFKAASWGDNDLDGTIDEHPQNAGKTVSSVETNGTDLLSCATDMDATYITGSSMTNFCESRYGVMDVVGNFFDSTWERKYGTYGLDNGIDGMQLGVTWPTDSTTTSHIDLLTGAIDGASGASGNFNGDIYGFDTNVELDWIGWGAPGGWVRDNAGRFFVDGSAEPNTKWNSEYISRCAY